MAKTFNGWTALYSCPSTYFTAPNGKRVYCANADVATIFSYVAEQWHKRIEPLPPATVNIGDPGVRTGFIVIHAYRAPNTNVGTGNRSNHRSATGMDINGHLHPYEATNPPHLKGAGYKDGFTTAQRNELIKIRNEIGKNSRGQYILRLGIHFAIGLRDGMHVEIAPGITATDVKAAAVRLRAANVVVTLTDAVREALDTCGYAGTIEGVKDFQKDTGLAVDGVPGPITTARLEDEVSKTLEAVKALDAKVDKLRGERTNAHVQTTATLEKISTQLNVVGRIAAEARDAIRGLLATKLTFTPTSSVGKVFPNGLTVRQALGYAASGVYVKAPGSGGPGNGSITAQAVEFEEDA